MNLQDIEIQKGEKIAPQDVSNYYCNEIKRVEQALEDAIRNLSIVKQAHKTKAQYYKVKELEVAVTVGTKYLWALKSKV